MISNDETYEKQIMSENWYNWSKYCNIENVKKHLPNFKYFISDQKNLESNCTEKVFKHVLSKKNLFESKNAKSLVRSGIPCRYVREFFLKMFNIEQSEESFKNKFKFVFKDRDPNFVGDFVPYFSGTKSLEESLPVHFLTSEGVQKLKEILWMLNSVIPVIEFSPIIIKLGSLLLLFCNQAETYEILRSLIEMNYNIKETFKIRWHMRFTYNDNLKIISSLCEAIKEISYKSGKETFDHLEAINFPPEKLYEDMVYGFLLDYLNFEGAIRFLPFFMLEGVKAIYRIVYALIKTLKTSILNVKSPDQIIKAFRENAKQIGDMNKLFNIAYSFKLTRYNNKYDFQKMPDRDLFANRRNSYYLPSFSTMSYILKEPEIIVLWSLLPQDLKIRDAKMIFNTETNGYNLSSVYGLNENYLTDSTILFVMETFEEEVFGGIMSNLFKHTNGKFERPLQSYLVSVRPYLAIYESNRSADDIIYCDNTCFMFGGGSKGPAIRVDNALSNGFSYPENCFGAPVLVENKDGEFKIKKMEIYILG
jgi:hypothetical protein